MHVLALLAALAAPSLAQQGGDPGSQYVTGLISTLNSLNLTRLVSVASVIANATQFNGPSFLAQLAQGNKTIFAPTNAALKKLPGTINDANANIPLLAYHIADGHYNLSDIAHSPNHTIIRSLLSDPDLVHLEGNKSQVIVAERSDNDKFSILNLLQKPEVERTVSYQNLLIHVVDEVLISPGTITNIVNRNNLTAMITALNGSNAIQALEAIRGVTLFVPMDTAFTTALTQLGSQAQNATLINAILANHVINGTSVYSTDFMNNTRQHTSAGGQPFTFTTNSSGTFVTSGPSSARIVRSDIPIMNGVIHLTSAVLANPASNPAAAAAAAAAQAGSASSGAAQNTTKTGSSSNDGTHTAEVGSAIIFSILAGMGTLLSGMLVL